MIDRNGFRRTLPPDRAQNAKLSDAIVLPINELDQTQLNEMRQQQQHRNDSILSAIIDITSNKSDSCVTVPTSEKHATAVTRHRNEYEKKNKFTVPFVPTQMPIIEIHIYAIICTIRTMSTPTDMSNEQTARCDRFFFSLHWLLVAVL